MVTLNEFTAVDVEAPIRDNNNVDCWTLGKLYQEAASKAEEESNQSALAVFGLLSAITNIHFKPEDRSEPFGPQFVMNGKRTMIPEDIRGDQSAVIAELIPTIDNPGLRARLSDIVWYNNRKLAAFAQQAVASYCLAVQLVLDGEAEFFDQNRIASSIDGCEMLRRACQIAHATGWKEPEASRLRTLVETVIRNTLFRRDHVGFFNSAQIALQFGIDNPDAIATNAEKFARSLGVDPHWTHDLWDLAARAHQSYGDTKNRARCLTEAAESFVAFADSVGGEGMVATNFFMSAIQVLRQVPNTKARRKEIEKKLRLAQTFVRDEMGAVSTTIDLTKHVQYALRTVRSEELATALARFASLATSPDPDTLREEAGKRAADNLLSTLMSSTVVDNDGKVVARSPAHIGGGADEDCALRYDIVLTEGQRRLTDVVGLIEPARQCIQSEHSLNRRDLRPLIVMTPMVPNDRVDLIATGFERFFGGDFFSALHILVPQLENSLRHILKQAGIDPSAIQSDMTQESRSLSVMLVQDRQTLEKILGPAIVFEIENLFDFRGGPALRHQLAHGLLSSSACYEFDSIYACWFMFRLCCLPLFPHWKHVSVSLDTP